MPLPIYKQQTHTRRSLTALERKVRQSETTYVSIPVLTVLTADRVCIALITEARGLRGRDLHKLLQLTPRHVMQSYLIFNVPNKDAKRPTCISASISTNAPVVREARPRPSNADRDYPTVRSYRNIPDDKAAASTCKLTVRTSSFPCHSACTSFHHYFITYPVKADRVCCG